jgi:hypothetical protein
MLMIALPGQWKQIVVPQSNPGQQLGTKDARTREIDVLEREVLLE